MDIGIINNFIASLPPLPSRNVDFWTTRRAELRQRILAEGLVDFLTWPTITSTMFVGSAGYISLEMQYLQAQGWERWRPALKEPWVGHPEPYRDALWTSGNFVHQAYHVAKWEEATGIRIDTLDRITEFGGGYGALALITHRLGFRGDYSIFDLPECSAIQRYYLHQCNLLSVECCTAKTCLGHLQRKRPDLFIALWSLSETDERNQQQVFDALRSRYVLIAAVDDQQFWQRLTKNPHYEWSIQRIDHIGHGENIYIYGMRKEST